MSYDHIGVVEDIQSILESRLKACQSRLTSEVKDNEHPEFKRGYNFRTEEEEKFLVETLKQIRELEHEADEDARFDEISDDDGDEDEDE